MKYRRLDENWDYVFGHGQTDYLTGRDAVGQAIKSRLLLLYGEWWEDQEDGLPLFERILASSGSDENKRAVDIIFARRIGDTTGVINVGWYDSSFDRKKRAYGFSCAVDTVYGELYVSNVREVQ